jgi:ribonuclease PH
VALHDALSQLERDTHPMRELVGAVSVGLLDGEALLDLCYEEDSAASVDLNVVMAESGRFIELQGTAEKQPFSAEELTRMIDCARTGIEEVFRVQRAVLELQAS